MYTVMGSKSPKHIVIIQCFLERSSETRYVQVVVATLVGNVASWFQCRWNEEMNSAAWLQCLGALVPVR